MTDDKLMLAGALVVVLLVLAAVGWAAWHLLSSPRETPGAQEVWSGQLLEANHVAPPGVAIEVGGDPRLITVDDYRHYLIHRPDYGPAPAFRWPDRVGRGFDRNDHSCPPGMVRERFRDFLAGGPNYRGGQHR